MLRAVLTQALLYDLCSTMHVTFDNESRCWSHKDHINACLDVKGGTVRDIDLPTQNVRASTQRPIGVCLSNHTRQLGRGITAYVLFHSDCVETTLTN